MLGIKFLKLSYFIWSYFSPIFGHKTNFIFRRRNYGHNNGKDTVHDSKRKYSDYKNHGHNHKGGKDHYHFKNNSRGGHDNFRSRGFRKRPYHERYNSRYHDDWRSGKQKPHPKYNQSWKANDYKYPNNREFKTPKKLTTFQQKKRHLKNLRKKAANMATKDPGNFVFKPGMIGLLRPDTPYVPNNVAPSRPQVRDPFKKVELREKD